VQSQILLTSSNSVTVGARVLKHDLIGEYATVSIARDATVSVTRSSTKQ